MISKTPIPALTGFRFFAEVWRIQVEQRLRSIVALDEQLPVKVLHRHAGESFVNIRQDGTEVNLPT